MSSVRGTTARATIKSANVYHVISFENELSDQLSDPPSMLVSLSIPTVISSADRGAACAASSSGYRNEPLSYGATFQRKNVTYSKDQNCGFFRKIINDDRSSDCMQNDDILLLLSHLTPWENACLRTLEPM